MEIYIVVKNNIERKWEPLNAWFRGYKRPVVVGIFLTKKAALEARTGNQEVFMVTPDTMLEIDDRDGYKLTPIT